MKTSRSTRIVAATLIAGSALFGLAPVAGADPSSSGSSQTSQDSSVKSPGAKSPKAKVASQPPAFNPRPLPSSAPKWLKRIEQKVTRFFQTHPGPFSRPPRQPGEPGNVMCDVFGSHCN